MDPDTNPMPEEPIVEPTPVPPIDANLRIIFRKEDGGVAVIIPVPDCGLTIEQVAAKDVPAGAPHRIVEADTIPSDRTFRAAWEWID
jgi:hypothetical protein